MIIELRAANGTEVGDYHLESAVQDTRFSYRYDYKLGANKSELGPRHSLNPQVWTRRIDNPRLNRATGNQWQYDQSEPNGVKTKDGTWRGDVASYDKS